MTQYQKVGGLQNRGKDVGGEGRRKGGTGGDWNWGGGPGGGERKGGVEHQKNHWTSFLIRVAFKNISSIQGGQGKQIRGGKRFPKRRVGGLEGGVEEQKQNKQKIRWEKRIEISARTKKRLAYCLKNPRRKKLQERESNPNTLKNPKQETQKNPMGDKRLKRGKKSKQPEEAEAPVQIRKSETTGGKGKEIQQSPNGGTCSVKNRVRSVHEEWNRTRAGQVTGGKNLLRGRIPRQATRKLDPHVEGKRKKKKKVDRDSEWSESNPEDKISRKKRETNKKERDVTLIQAHKCGVRKISRKKKNAEQKVKSGGRKKDLAL